MTSIQERIEDPTPGPNYPKKHDTEKLYYEINDTPPWYLTILLGFQHYLTMVGGTVSVPFIICPAMCMDEDDEGRSKIISTIIFVSGIVTLLQSTFGTRLPIIQGGSFSFIIPTMAILSLNKWKCPETSQMTSDEKTEVWEQRMREIQGAIICASLFEVCFGFFGIIGVILRFITPLTVAPAIAMIGLGLFKVAAKHAAVNWPIALLTIALIAIFSQYLKSVKISIPFTKSDEVGNKWSRYPFFEVFPVLLTMGIVWLLCGILTLTNVLAEGNAARTDARGIIVQQTSWIRVPYPFQWGWPTVTTGAVFGMFAGVLASTVESIGDYYAAARISGASKPPTHAINRGIFIEGFGCVLAGIWGTGNGSTSYSENIGAISVTKVGARRVIQAAGCLMILCSLIGKIGAAFISIPEPIIGGVFCVVFATVTAVGLSNLQGVNLSSSRNIFIIGFSIFFGLVISEWIGKDENKQAIDIGNESLNQIIYILLHTGMFVSGFLGFFLDNTIPGTKEERGLIEWSSHLNIESNESLGRDTSYDLPYIMNFIKRHSWLKRLPISPTYEKFFSSKLPKNSPSHLSKMDKVNKENNETTPI